ncbi:hypothetical protein BH23CHL2_BH23CHL2_25880 [soil metagenome]
MSDDARLPVAAAVVVLVESAGRFLLTEEDPGGVAGPVWYFPSGALEPDESLAGAARREVREETGYEVEPIDVMAIDHGEFQGWPGLFWWRLAISARLVSDSRQPVGEPEILSVRWCYPDELARLPLRSLDAIELCERLRSGHGLPLDACRLAEDGRLEGFFD